VPFIVFLHSRHALSPPVSPSFSESLAAIATKIAGTRATPQERPRARRGRGEEVPFGKNGTRQHRMVRCDTALMQMKLRCTPLRHRVEPAPTNGCPHDRLLPRPLPLGKPTIRSKRRYRPYQLIHNATARPRFRLRDGIAALIKIKVAGLRGALLPTHDPYGDMECQFDQGSRPGRCHPAQDDQA